MKQQQQGDPWSIGSIFWSVLAALAFVGALWALYDANRTANAQIDREVEEASAEARRFSESFRR